MVLSQKCKHYSPQTLMNHSHFWAWEYILPLSDADDDDQQFADETEMTAICWWDWDDSNLLMRLRWQLFADETEMTAICWWDWDDSNLLMRLRWQQFACCLCRNSLKNSGRVTLNVWSPLMDTPFSIWWEKTFALTIKQCNSKYIYIYIPKVWNLADTLYTVVRP